MGKKRQEVNYNYSALAYLAPSLCVFTAETGRSLFDHILG